MRSKQSLPEFKKRRFFFPVRCIYFTNVYNDPSTSTQTENALNCDSLNQKPNKNPYTNRVRLKTKHSRTNSQNLILDCFSAWDEVKQIKIQSVSCWDDNVDDKAGCPGDTGARPEVWWNNNVKYGNNKIVLAMNHFVGFGLKLCNYFYIRTCYACRGRALILGFKCVGTALTDINKYE